MRYVAKTATALLSLCQDRLIHFVVRSTTRLLLRCQLNHVIDSQDSDGGFGRELETFHLGDGRLKHARRLVVPYFAIEQVQAVPMLFRV